MTFYLLACGQVIKLVYAIPGIVPKQYRSVKSEKYMFALLRTQNKLELYLTIRSSK